IEYLLYKSFSPPELPVIGASFAREGTPPGVCSEIVRAANEDIRLSWWQFLEPFNFAADPGFDGRPIGVQTTFFPGGAAQFSLNGRKAEGTPWPIERGGKACTTACLAWCESWFRPR